MANMLRSLPGGRRFAFASAFLSTTFAYSELVVNSSNGYQVHIYIELTQLVPSSLTCPYGYNYNVLMDYQVWFTGSNIPGSLYTLQGTVGCGSTDLFFDLPNNGGDGSILTTSNPYRSQSDCATASLGLLGCHTARIQIEGPGISSQFINYTTDVLPVELVSFSAASELGHVRLAWTTATEADNAYFTVERSEQGIEFMPIQVIPGAGNSQEMINYSTLDRNALEGLAYYRLKQTDTDGSFTYSPVVAALNVDEPVPVIAPNPCASDQFQLSGDVIGHTLEIRSSDGQLVRSLRLNSNTVQRSGLAAGVFSLSLLDPITGVVSSQKLVLQ